MERSEKK